MYFKNREHKESFLRLQARAGIVGDREYSSALYLLAATGKDLSKFVRKNAIEFEQVFDYFGRWSSSERALVKLAANIFTAGYFEAHVHSILTTLDQENGKVALEALRMRYF